VGGRFANAGGDPDADKIARWDGSTWHALGDGLDQYTDTVYGIAVSGPGVYVGGEIRNAGGDQNADNIVRWDGSAWRAFDSGLHHELGASGVSPEYTGIRSMCRKPVRNHYGGFWETEQDEYNHPIYRHSTCWNCCLVLFS
jgi:hypothetical protein